ncbi:MAG: tyrosine-type recombinase/integrase [Eubacteriales bacterium]|nr:tyrosine-type recombinase/integrase [Eubacteriales bacterium]
MSGGAVSFAKGNQGTITDGKTSNSQRTIPLAEPLVSVLQGHHGLLCTKEDGSFMTQAAFDRKYESFINYLELQLNGCTRGWYGKKKEHRELLAKGEKLPPWRDVNIRCHDFRVDFCTRCYFAGIPLKTLQIWMGHSDVQMITEIYSKLTKQQEDSDAVKLAAYMEKSTA